MPVIIFFQHLKKNAIHLGSTSFVFHRRSLSTLFFYFFEGNMSFTVSNFSPVCDFQEFYYGIPSCDFFSFILFGISFFKSVLIFHSSGLFLFLLFLQICFCFLFSLLIFCLLNYTHLRAFHYNSLAHLYSFYI